jgi:hypothetical protein
MKRTMEKTLAILLVAIFVASSIFILPAYSDDGEQPTLFSVRQGANTWIVEPIQGSLSAVEFYNYVPNSGYAPYMEYRKSKIYLYEDTEGELSLIIHHNKAALPVVSFGLNMSIEGLPYDAYVALSDDSGEFYFTGVGRVLGGWPVVSHNDSEGGIISGLQGMDWTITVYAGAAGQIDTWEWQTATGAIPLDLLMYGEPGPIVPVIISNNYIPPGEDITVYPHPDVVLTFDEVLTGGVVHVTTSFDPPPGYPLEGIGPYYYIAANPLTFTTVSIGIHYDDTGLDPEQEAALGLWRFDPAVPVKGDVDGNGKVDLKDQLKITLALGTKPGQKRWNPACDLNGDNKIDLKDLCIAVMNFGKRSTPASWTNITFEVDTVNNIVYGNTDHFSPYRVR